MKTMKTLYLDCNAGVSGNMFLGALIDLGFPFEELKQSLAKLPVHLPELRLERVTKNGIGAQYFDVPHFHEHQHRRLQDITALIEGAALSPTVKERAVHCFRELATAEAKIHGVSLEEIHFHEVGAVDAIVDIVGACLGIEYLKIDRILVSPIRMGFGMIECAHGLIPLPAPAAAELLKGYAVFGGDHEGEWTTPTGAALLKEWATSVKSMPALSVERIGYGAGSADRPIPNVLRIFYGETAADPTQDTQVVLETNIDNMNPEFFGFLGEQLFAAGARDYFLTPVYMKKGRPGTLITVLAPPERESAMEKILLTQTTTLGVRKYTVDRTCLERKTFQVQLGEAAIQIKAGLFDGRVIKVAPEYDDCVRAAQQSARPVKDIYEEAFLIAKSQWLKEKEL